MNCIKTPFSSPKAEASTKGEPCHAHPEPGCWFWGKHSRAGSLHLPKHTPDMGRIAPGLGWLLSRSLSFRADGLKRIPKPYIIDFLHIL